MKSSGEILTSTFLRRVYEYAERAHGSQKRKYTGEPYIVHPLAVAEIVGTVTDDETIIAAALLHDVIEDTPITFEDIVLSFNRSIACLVDQVTDVSKPSDGNRAARKAIDKEHLAKASSDAQTIKLADLIHNTESIVPRDPGFAKVYMAEKRELIGVLTGGDVRLFARAANQVIEYYKGHEMRISHLKDAVAVLGGLDAVEKITPALAATLRAEHDSEMETLRGKS